VFCAKKTERARNLLAAKPVEEFIALNAWQIEKIKAGINAADHGGFAPDADLARVRTKFAIKK
jgi:predicted transcriptional regulator